MDRDVSRDVGEKTDRDDVVTDSLDGAKRRADLGLLDLKTVLGIDGFGNVSVRDRTEETAVNAALGRDFDFAFVDRVGDLLGGSDTFGLSGFELGTTGFKFGDGSLRGALGTAGRDQEVAAVAILDLDDVAEVTNVSNLLEKNNLHLISP